jgi:hypothetical protein
MFRIGGKMVIVTVVVLGFIIWWVFWSLNFDDETLWHRKIDRFMERRGFCKFGYKPSLLGCVQTFYYKNTAMGTLVFVAKWAIFLGVPYLAFIVAAPF